MQAPQNNEQNKPAPQQQQTQARPQQANPQVNMRPEPPAGANAVAPIRTHELFFAQQNVMARIAEHCQCGDAQVKRIVRGILQAMRTSQDDKILTCTPESFLNCIYDAYALGLEIDARQHAYLVRYGNEAALAPGYMGYLHKLDQGLDGFDHEVFLIWPGDHFRKGSKNGLAWYEYEAAEGKEARSDYGKIEAVHCYISYYIHGEKRAHIESLDREEVNKIRSKAKSQKVWGEWMGEQVKKACIRRACKTRFKSLVGELMARDNEEFELEAPGGSESMQEARHAKSSERIKNRLRERGAPEAPQPPVVDGEFSEERQAGQEEVDKAPVTQAEAQPEPETTTPAEEQLRTETHQLEPENTPAPAEGMIIENDEVPIQGFQRSEEELAKYSSYAGAEPWRGKLTIGGREVNKDFPNVLQAFSYLTAVITKRTKRGVRWAVLNENTSFMAAIFTQNPDIHDSLIALANQGEADDATA